MALSIQDFKITEKEFYSLLKGFSPAAGESMVTFYTAGKGWLRLTTAFIIYNYDFSSLPENEFKKVGERAAKILKGQVRKGNLFLGL